MWNTPKCVMIWKGKGMKSIASRLSVSKPIILHTDNSLSNMQGTQCQDPTCNINKGCVLSFTFDFLFPGVSSSQDFWPRKHAWSSCRSRHFLTLQSQDHCDALCCTCRRPRRPSPRTCSRSRWPAPRAAWSWRSPLRRWWRRAPCSWRWTPSRTCGGEAWWGSCTCWSHSSERGRCRGRLRKSSWNPS